MIKEESLTISIIIYHTAGSDTIFVQIYMDAPTGVPGVSKNQIYFFTNKTVKFVPKIGPNIKNRVFWFELFSVHLPL